MGVICERGDFSVFNGGVVRAVEDYGWVLHFRRCGGIGKLKVNLWIGETLEKNLSLYLVEDAGNPVDVPIDYVC